MIYFVSLYLASPLIHATSFICFKIFWTKGGSLSLSPSLYYAHVNKNLMRMGFLRAAETTYRNSKTSFGFQAPVPVSFPSWTLYWSRVLDKGHVMSKFRAVVILGPGKRNKSTAVTAWSQDGASLSLHFWWYMTSRNIDLAGCLYFPGSTRYYGFLPFCKQQPWLNILAVPSDTDLILPAASLPSRGAPTPSIKAALGA